MCQAGRTLPVPSCFERNGRANGLRAHTDDLATDPCVSGAVTVAADPGKLPAAVLGMIGQQLAHGVTREVAAQPNPLYLVLDVSHGHRRPA
jgi:hypothetical protein